MNVLFLLTPKRDVIHLSNNHTIRQAYETMKAHQRTVLPVLDPEGNYVGTVSSLQILNFALEQEGIELAHLEKFGLSLILDQDSDPPLRINMDFDTLMDRLAKREFVTVVDDRGIFMGIITRKSLVNSLHKPRPPLIRPAQRFGETIAEEVYERPLGAARLRSF